VSFCKVHSSINLNLIKHLYLVTVNIEGQPEHRFCPNNSPSSLSRPHLTIPHTPKRKRQHRGTPIPAFPHTPDPKNNIILVHRRTREIKPLHIAHLNHIRPKTLRRPAIHNLIPDRSQSLWCIPFKLAKIVGRSCVDTDVPWFPRCIRKTPHRSSNDLRGAGIIFEIKPLNQIAILFTIPHGDVLVLLSVIFVGLDEAYACVSGFEERAVVAAAGVAVEAVDEAHSHLGEDVGSDLVDVAAEIAGWAVVIAADAEAGCCGVGGFG
jgi:hypothetical protein